MGYLIGIATVGVFIGIVFILVKKQNVDLENMLAMLTQEQKEMLEDNQVENFDYKKHTWFQRGMIAQVKEKNNKVALKVLWYNTIIQNDTLNQCQYADIKMKKTDFDHHGLKNGDFVKMFIDPEKANAKIIFD